MTNLEKLTGLTIYDVRDMKRRLDEFILTPEFNQTQGAARRTAYRRVAVHLSHILSGFRMEKSNDYEDARQIYARK